MPHWERCLVAFTPVSVKSTFTAKTYLFFFYENVKSKELVNSFENGQNMQ